VRIWVAGACLALVLVAATAEPAVANGVAIQLQGSDRPVVVSTDEIGALADVPATRYRVRSRPGRDARTLTFAGTRLATVLRAAGVDPASVPTLEITRDDGSILYLPRNEVDPSSGPPPLLYPSGRSVGFVRDSQALDDLNAGDVFTSSSGTPIRITVSETATLSVRVRAGDAEIEAGGRVRFEADVAGELPDEALTYEWRFGDGRTATTEEAMHRFARRGRYEVMLQVTGDQRSGGTSEPVVVQVGPPERREPRTGAGRSRSHGAPASGPVDGAGGSGATPAPARGTPSPQEPARRRSTPSPRRQGPRVGGVVLGEQEPAARPAQATPGGPALARTGSEEGELSLGWMAAACGCLLLLTVGATGEWRAGARRRARTLGR
jgi:hypothetical protein